MASPPPCRTCSTARAMTPACWPESSPRSKAAETARREGRRRASWTWAGAGLGLRWGARVDLGVGGAGADVEGVAEPLAGGQGHGRLVVGLRRGPVEGADGGGDGR